MYKFALISSCFTVVPIVRCHVICESNKRSARTVIAHNVQKFVHTVGLHVNNLTQVDQCGELGYALPETTQLIYTLTHIINQVI